MEGFVYGHAADGSATDLVVPESAKRILPEADGRLGRAIALTLATHASPLAFVRWEVGKVGALFASYEATDNASWYYFARRSPMLAMLPGFPLVLALGLVGLVVAPRRDAGDVLLRGFLLITAAERNNRAIEYGMTAAWYQEHGHSDAAMSELAEGLASAYAAPDRPVLPAGYDKLAMGLVEIAGQTGRAADVAPTLEALAARFPVDRNLRAVLVVLYRDLLHDEAKAAAHEAAADRVAAPPAP